MMDIVQRLRAVGGYFDEAAKKHVSCCEAADEIEALRARIAELEAERVKVPEGYALVPVEPSRDMLIAAADGYETGEVFGPESCYRAMLAAAPSPVKD
jgi:hypothetical protein